MTNLSFDNYAWGDRRQRPVSAKTKISFQDYASMQTFQHKQSGERRLPTPYWALNDKMFRQLLVVFMEARVGLKSNNWIAVSRQQIKLRVDRNPSLTEEQKADAVEEELLRLRLDRARLAALGQHPRLNDTVDRLNMEYVQTQRRGVDSEEVARRNVDSFLPGFEDEGVRQATSERLAELEVEIEGLDTYLRYTRNGGAGVLAQVVYLYYRVGLDSVGVAEETGLKPPHVRQLLYRLNEMWKEKFPHVKEETSELPSEPLFTFLDADLS